MAEIRILGPDGRPIDKAVLTEEFATASVTGVRNVWNYNSVANNLTPQRLAQLLRGAVQGDHIDYLTLAEEMEDRDMHYFSVLGTRKMAVSGIEPVVEAASDDTLHVKHADAVRELIRAPEFGEASDDQMDALGKCYSAVEIVWDRSGREWYPRYKWRDPRFFVFDRVTGQELRMLDTEDMLNGVALPPYKFMVHIPRIKTGLPIRRGFARLAATCYMCKSYSLSDWLAFAEVFGMPIRVGRHGPNASKDDIRTLVRAVANIGTDAAAVIPESMKIEFIEAARGSGGEELFERMANFFDKQMSKGILGQTASTEGTPGKLGNDQEQGDVRRDIKRADAKQLQNTINRSVVKWFIDLNFGPQDKYPRVLFPVQEPEDLTAIANGLNTLVPLGLKVEQSWARDKFGIPEPEDDADLLVAPQANVNSLALNRAGRHYFQALNRQGNTTDEIDALAAGAVDDWEEQMQPVIDPIQQLADSVDSFEEFFEKLPALLEEEGINESELVKRLAKTMFQARGLGDAKDQV